MPNDARDHDPEERDPRDHDEHAADEHAADEHAAHHEAPDDRTSDEPDNPAWPDDLAAMDWTPAEPDNDDLDDLPGPAGTSGLPFDLQALLGPMAGAMPMDLEAMLGQLGLGSGSPEDLGAAMQAMLSQLGLGGGSPDDLQAMLGQLGLGGGPPEDLGAAMQAMQAQLGALFGAMSGATAGRPQPTGPVDWGLATHVALQLAADGDRAPSDDEAQAAERAFSLAEHWLDASPLPAPPDAGRVVIATRQQWVNVAIAALRPLVEPVARAASDGLLALAEEQFSALTDDDGQLDLDAMPGLEGLPPELRPMLGALSDMDLGAMLRPATAALAGLQAGQVVGQLSRQLLGQYDLGVPTAPRSEAHCIAVNVAETFEGYDLDATEVAIVLAVSEAAHRRLYHAVPWLEAHVQSLVARFASGTVVDAARLQELTEELLGGIDPEDPDALERAMSRAASFRLEPTPDQRRILERLQGVVCLVGAWARHEVTRVLEGKLPSLERIAEVLRRRRATRGDGEELLAGLLGLDLKPDDESIGEAFVAAVEAALGPAGLHRALAHPENLPDAEELADPARWSARTADDLDIPDDASALFGEIGAAPVEASADERTQASGHEGRDDPQGTDDTDGGDNGSH